MPSHLTLRAVWGGRSGVFEEEVDDVWRCMSCLAGYGELFQGAWFDVEHPNAILDSKEALAGSMWRTRTSGDGPQYFFSQDTYVRDDPPRPYVSLDADVSFPKKHGYPTANQVTVNIETDTLSLSQLPAEVVRWVFGIGVGLVKDMVDIWHPDAVSLHSLELVTLPRQLGLVGAFPTLGYVSWLSSVLIDAKDVPRSRVREPYKGGLVLGIDPMSPDPVGDATMMALRLYRSGKLRVVPPIQQQNGGWSSLPQPDRL